VRKQRCRCGYVVEGFTDAALAKAKHEHEELFHPERIERRREQARRLLKASDERHITP
jgi:hypothetical protein